MARKVKFRNEGYLGTGAIPKCRALHYQCKAKSAISNGYPKSDYSDMEVFRDFVNDFESEMACNRQSKRS